MLTQEADRGSRLLFVDVAKLRSGLDRCASSARAGFQVDAFLPVGSFRSQCMGLSRSDSLRRPCALCGDKLLGHASRTGRADSRLRCWLWSPRNRTPQSASWETFSGALDGNVAPSQRYAAQQDRSLLGGNTASHCLCYQPSALAPGERPTDGYHELVN